MEGVGSWVLLAAGWWGVGSSSEKESEAGSSVVSGMGFSPVACRLSGHSDPSDEEEEGDGRRTYGLGVG